MPCDAPLEWWHRHLASPQFGGTLHLLAPLARMYLALPASSADLERSFSSAGFILEGRHRLLVRNLEAQVVIRDYLLELERTLDEAAYEGKITELITEL